MKKSLRITKDQTKLTPEQLEEVKKYAQRQINKFLSTEKVNKKEVEQYVMNAYKISGTKLPKKVRWFKSPEDMCKHRNSVGDSVGDSVWGSVRDSVRDSVGGSVGGSVRDSVWGSVRGSVRDSVWGSVWDSVRDSVGDSVRGYYDANIWSFYGFFNEYFEKNDIVWLLKLSENVTGYVFYENECWLVEHPKTLDRDEQGRLHSTKGKAIEWRDGVGYYFIHGVKFEEKLFKRVVKKGVHTKTILTLENIEQRMAVLKIHGVEKIIKNAKLLDKSDRGNELYLLKNVFSTDAYFLKYSCPSTGRVYTSGIDPEVGKKGNADECMSWKFNLSLDDYKKLQIES